MGKFYSCSDRTSFEGHQQAFHTHNFRNNCKDMISFLCYRSERVASFSSLLIELFLSHEQNINTILPYSYTRNLANFIFLLHIDSRKNVDASFLRRAAPAVQWWQSKVAAMLNDCSGPGCERSLECENERTKFQWQQRAAAAAGAPRRFTRTGNLCDATRGGMGFPHIRIGK